MKALGLASCLAVCLIVAVGSCSSYRENEQSFGLYVLGTSAWQLGSQRDQAWAVLREADLTRSIWVITEDDIEVYEWSAQSIVLTPEASAALREAFPEYWAWGGLRAPFVVTFEGEWLYGGAFAEAGSAVAMIYPVIYFDTRDDSIVLTMRPFNRPGFISAESYSALDPSVRGIIEVEQVREYFLELDRLAE